MAAILEPNRIWREHQDPGARERGPKRLQRFTRQPGNLALPYGLIRESAPRRRVG